MAQFEDHCRACVEELGEPFEEVHRWLDAFFGQPGIGSRHRRYRHHRQGIEVVREMWGDRAAQAAVNHIRLDLADEGWPEDRPLPANEDAYVKAGLW